MAKVDMSFRINADEPKKFYVEVLNTSGKVIARGAKTYSSDKTARNSIPTMYTELADALIRFSKVLGCKSELVPTKQKRGEARQATVTN